MGALKSTLYLLVACFIGGSVAYFNDLGYWQASAIGLGAYGLVMLIDWSVTKRFRHHKSKQT